MNTKPIFRFVMIIVLLLTINMTATTSTAHNPLQFQAESIEIVSIASDGSQGNDSSNQVSISGDGRYVAFGSWATNLVANDNNNFCYAGGEPTENCPDGFMHDRETDQTSLVSVDNNGNQANSYSTVFVISAGGAHVAFISSGDNLVGGDTNQKDDIFVHELKTGVTRLVSVSSSGTQANNTSWSNSISGDGRYVAFESDATNLVSGDTNNYCDDDHDGIYDDDCRDIFVHDIVTGETIRVSISSEGLQSNGESFSPSISMDGRHVAFESMANNLVSEDTNEVADVFVHDLDTGVTKLVSISSDGTQGNDRSGFASISGNGRFVAFQSLATNLVTGDTNNYCDEDWDGVYDDNCHDIFVRDLENGETRRISVASDGTQGNGKSLAASISANGRFVAFESMASNLVAGDTNDDCYTGDAPVNPYNCEDIFVHNWETGETQLISVADDGTQGNNNSYGASISANGRYVAFISEASNLVSGDINGTSDAFVADRGMIFLQTFLPITVR